MSRTSVFAFMSMLLLCSSASAQFIESESNDSKATANVFALTPVGTITGTSINSATTGLDYYRISISGLTPGIYRHRLLLTSTTAGHTGTIRGLNQTGTGAGNAAGTGGTIGTTDAAPQSSSTLTVPARFNQFYGFGNPSAELYYRVTGTAATTADYLATLETTPVVPTSIGNFQQGPITISTVGQTTVDTDFWVYDSSFNAIAGYGNDDSSVFGGAPNNTGLQSFLQRSYAPGTYYIAISNFNLANNMASPNDERTPSGTVLDFPGFIANSSTTTNLNLNFQISDGVNTFSAVNTKVGAFDVNWFTFTVVPEPSAMLMCLVGMSIVARRRRTSV